jgi:hypothetical protein
MGAVRRHPRLAALALAIIVLAAALPATAYLVVPQLVRSTLVEELPTAAPSAALADPAASPAPSVPGTDTLLQGDLVRITLVDFGSGTVRIVRVGAERFLRFEDVEIAGAPDMYVYLSDRTDGRPGTYVDLGKLKATNGSFNYVVPPEIDLATVRSVVVWCRQFNVTVTYAELRSG